MSVTLADYLKGASGRPFVWGECDCCLFAADWIKARTGIDPAAALRGAYASEFEAKDVMHRTGTQTFSDFVCLHMTLADVAETVDPQEGDVGILRVPVHGETVGIRTGLGRWAFKTRRGVFTGACPDVVVAWSIP